MTSPHGGRPEPDAGAVSVQEYCLKAGVSIFASCELGELPNAYLYGNPPWFFSDR